MKFDVSNNDESFTGRKRSISNQKADANFAKTKLAE